MTTLSELLLASFYRQRTNTARAEAGARAVLKAIADGGVTDLDRAVLGDGLTRLYDQLDGTLIYRPPGEREWRPYPERGTA